MYNVDCALSKFIAIVFINCKKYIICVIVCAFIFLELYVAFLCI